MWPASFVYRLLLGVHALPWRLGWRRAWRAPVPVIVVGNVVAGGAGKTPTVIALVQHLRRQGWPVGVVSRGHGRRFDDAAGGRPSDVREVVPDSDPAMVGDEPLLIAQRCAVPVVVGRDRPAAVRALLAWAPQTRVVVCDDGLQHRLLAHDLSICVFDDRGLGNGWLLPAGPLREPWPRAVDWVLNTGGQPALPGHRAMRRLAALARRADGTTCTLAQLAQHAGAGSLAVAGIAQPQRFFDMLAAADIRPQDTLALPDHYSFDSCPSPVVNASTLFCTEKDAVKLWRHRPDAWAVALELALDPALLRALDARLSSWDGSPPA